MFNATSAVGLVLVSIGTKTTWHPSWSGMSSPRYTIRPLYFCNETPCSACFNPHSVKRFAIFTLFPEIFDCSLGLPQLQAPSLPVGPPLPKRRAFSYMPGNPLYTIQLHRSNRIGSAWRMLLDLLPLNIPCSNGCRVILALAGLRPMALLERLSLTAAACSPLLLLRSSSVLRTQALLQVEFLFLLAHG